jgi:F0F1-type ATP synthase assembly protein I
VETRQQGSILFSAVLVLIATLVVIQLWLVATTVDALLGRQADVLLPSAIASGALFVLAVGLLWYIVSFDARLRQWGRGDR